MALVKMACALHFMTVSSVCGDQSRRMCVLTRLMEENPTFTCRFSELVVGWLRAGMRPLQEE